MAAFSARDLQRVEARAPAPAPIAPREPANTALLKSLAAEPVKSAYSPVVVAGLVRAAEFILIVLTGTLIYRFYVASLVGYGAIYFLVTPTIAIMSVLVFQMLQTYNLAAFRQPIRQIFRISGGWSFVFLVIFAGLFFLKLEGVVSRVWIGSWFFVGMGALAVERAVLARIALALAKSGRLARRAVVVGGGEFGQSLLRDFDAASGPDISMVGVFDDRSDDRSPQTVEGFPKLGNVDDLVEFARHTRIDLVIFALPITAEQRILQMLRKLWVLPIDIRLAAHANRLRFRPRSYS
jgi:FlaA1/EpsC-like NDP-sugar epimerase